MNAIMNIQIRVAAGQANAALAGVNKQIAGLGAGGAATGMSKFFSTISAGTAVLERHGKALQWTGRQLTFNFTLPLVAATYAALKWSNANAEGIANIRKVYGDFSYTTERVNSEVDALAHSFEMLSTKFGINQKEVLDVAGAWAQAGSAGVGLANATQLTLETMILGQLDATKATEGLIAIQSAFGLQTQKTSDDVLTMHEAVAQLNAIENQTAVSMADLIEGSARVGSAAKNAGIDIRHMGALIAALVPTTGSASQAGNALRTIISRLEAPTKDTLDVFKELGIEFASQDWQSKNVVQRLEAMSQKFQDLNQNEKNVVASTIASRWQVNRFDQLMGDIASSTGYYNKALAATADQQKDNALYANELTTVLSSQPKQFDILTNSIKNNMAKAIIPLIPSILSLVYRIEELVKAFTNLDPQTQQFILGMLATLAIIGPIVQYLGAFMLLFAQMGKVFVGVGKATFWLAKQLYQLFFTQATGAANAALANESAAAASAAAWEEEAGAATAAAEEQRMAYDAAAAAMADANIAAAAAAGEANVAGAQAAADAWVAAGEIGAGFMTSAMGEIASVSMISAGFQVDSAGIVMSANEVAAAGSAAVWTAAYGMIAIGAGGAAMAVAGAAGETVAVMGEIGAGAAGVAGEIGAAEAATGGFFASIGGIFAGIGAWVSALAGWFAAGAAYIAQAWAVSDGFAAFVTELGVIIGEVGVGAAASMAAVVVAIAAAVAAALFLIWHFRDQIWEAMKSVGRAIWALPEVFVKALTALAKVVHDAVVKILDLLSYLNPWAKHSPSMVENVTSGVAAIIAQYANLRQIPGMLNAAAAAHQNFLNATAPQSAGFASAEQQQQKDEILKAAPSAGPAVDALIGQINALKALLPALTAEIRAQNAVVDMWQTKLDAIDKQLADVTKTVDAAKSRLQELGQMDLPGMRAMSDEIFNNEMAQKRLRLEIMKMEDANGTYEDLQNKAAAARGEIEKLQGEQKDLRDAGAGSDVLKKYDEEIKKIQEQGDGYTKQADKIAEMNKKLDELQRKGEELNLENSINFDPQLRQIQQMISGLHEMPFDEIVRQINEQNAVLAKQEPIMANLQAQHDMVDARLQDEKDKLDALNKAYDAITGAISTMEGAMSDFASSAKQAADQGSRIADLMDAASMGNFDIPQGNAIVSPEGDLTDIQKFNDDLQKQLDDISKKFADIDMFKPIKDSWEKVWTKIKDNLPTVLGGLLGGIAGFFVGGPFGAVIGAAIGGAIASHGSEILDGIKTAFGWVKDHLVQVILVGILPGFTLVGIAALAVFKGLKWGWDNILYPVLSAIVGFLSGPFLWVWDKISSVASAVWGFITEAISIAWGIMQPILQALWDFFTGYIIPIFELFAAIVAIYFLGTAILIWRAWTDFIWPALQAIWSFITDNIGPVFEWLWDKIIRPVFDNIVGQIQWAWDIIKFIFGIIKWTIENVVGPVFSWLWNSVIKPAWDGIVTGIKWGWDNVISPIFNGIKWAIENIVAPAFTWLRDNIIKPVWDAITMVIAGAWDKIGSIIENGINWFINVFNKLADGVNWLTDALGIPIHVSHMDQISIGGGADNQGAGPNQIGMFAKGGTWPLDNEGFVTNVATAIVGEGNSSYDEFVIPTDPKYRKRAQMLYGALGQRLGQPQMLAGGGVIGDLVNGGKDVITNGANIIKGFWDLINTAKDMVMNGLSNMGPLAGGVASFIKDKVIDWGTEKIKSIPGIGLIMDIGGKILGAGQAILDAVTDPVGTVKDALGIQRGGIIPSLGAGGIVLPRPGGTLVNLAERGRPEKILPLDSRHDKGGDNIYNFYGDLSFPNVKDGDDADQFLTNLRGLAS